MVVGPFDPFNEIQGRPEPDRTGDKLRINPELGRRVDGKKLAEELIAELTEERKKISGPIHLVAVLVGSNVGSVHYLKQKEKAAEKIGVTFQIHQFPEMISAASLKEKVLTLAKDPQNTGVIIQLPLPLGIDAQAILDSVPLTKDVDMLSEESVGAFFDGHATNLPPVVGAIDLILKKSNVEPAGKFVVIVGAGRLVGLPAMIWFSHNGATVCLVNRGAEDLSRYTRQAEILVTGSGVPRSITGDMLREGVVILDAAYEVVDGKASGDVDFDSAQGKASLITPVPGGIGPLTVTMLFKNLLSLAKAQRNV